MVRHWRERWKNNLYYGSLILGTWDSRGGDVERRCPREDGGY